MGGVTFSRCGIERHQIKGSARGNIHCPNLTAVIISKDVVIFAIGANCQIAVFALGMELDRRGKIEWKSACAQRRKGYPGWHDVLANGGNAEGVGEGGAKMVW